MHWRLLSSWFRSRDELGVDESSRFPSPNSVEEGDALLSQSKFKSTQYGDNLVFKIFQKLVSNERANLFPKIRDRITKQFAFYCCIIVNTCDITARR